MVNKRVNSNQEAIHSLEMGTLRGRRPYQETLKTGIINVR